MNSSEVRDAVYRQLLRHRHEVFQTFQIREELGWSEADPKARRLHAIIQELKRAGILGLTGTARKRNQYLMLEKPDELQMRLGRLRIKASSPNGGSPAQPPATKPGPQRVRYLEDRIADMDERLVEIVKAVGEIRTKVDDLDELRLKIEDLHREWVSS